MKNVKVTNSNPFTVVSEVQVITLSNGVYKNAAVYSRDGRLYAKDKGGFISLRSNKLTSHINVKWDCFVVLTNTPFEYKEGPLSWLELV